MSVRWVPLSRWYSAQVLPVKRPFVVWLRIAGLRYGYREHLEHLLMQRHKEVRNEQPSSNETDA
jgi:hypothetical protein